MEVEETAPIAPASTAQITTGEPVQLSFFGDTQGMERPRRSRDSGEAGISFEDELASIQGSPISEGPALADATDTAFIPPALPELFTPEPGAAGYDALRTAVPAGSHATKPWGRGSFRTRAAGDVRWQGMRTLLVPIAAFLGLLTILSFYVQYNPETSLIVGSRSFGAGPQPAPDGVVISSTRFRQIQLDNGENLPLISGSLVNQSAEDLQEVIIEALAFDLGGKNVVARARGIVGSELSRGKLKGISLEEVRKLSEQRDRKQSLRSGEETPFAIPLIEGDLSKARYYTARIYSAR
jgi:hypothetical protein